jgi:hypothetical protein
LWPEINFLQPISALVTVDFATKGDLPAPGEHRALNSWYEKFQADLAPRLRSGSNRTQDVHEMA